jgi:hypothetical protein
MSSSVQQSVVKKDRSTFVNKTYLMTIIDVPGKISEENKIIMQSATHARQFWHILPKARNTYHQPA